MRHSSAVLCLLAMVLLGQPALATDLRIQLNPALAELHAKDPARAEAVLEALSKIIEGDAPAPQATRSIDDPRHRALIEGNPLLEEAWRIDPKAALDQLKEIVAAGGG